MELLIQYTLLYASVLILVALGGCFSEHSGVINLGLEGIMVIGALGGALTMSVIQKSFPDASAFSVIISVVLVAVIFGIIYSLLLAVACVNFNADQTIIGTALNILGVALATVIVKAINTAADPNNVSSVVEYINAKKAFIHQCRGHAAKLVYDNNRADTCSSIYYALQDKTGSETYGVRRTSAGCGPALESAYTR